MTSNTEIIDVYWNHYHIGRVLFHSYVLTRFGNIDLLKKHVSFMSEANDYTAFVRILDESSITDRNGELINDQSLEDMNPFKIVGDKIEAEIGDIDRFRIAVSGKNHRFWDFYSAAFKRGSEFRKIVIQHLAESLNRDTLKHPVVEVEEIIDHQIRHFEIWVISYESRWRLLLGVASESEIRAESVLAVRTLSNHNDCTPAIIAPAFSRHAIMQSETFDVDLITLLHFMKMSVLLTKHHEAKTMNDSREKFIDLFQQHGGILQVFDWLSTESNHQP